MNSKLMLGLASATLLALPLVLNGVPGFCGGAEVYAAGKPNDKGGGGGGGGGGKPDGPGKGNGDLYADLVVKYRDISGLPIFVGVPAAEEEDPEEQGAITLRTRSLAAPVPTGYVACEQPITEPAIEGDEGIDAYGDSTMVLWSLQSLENPFINDADGKEVSPVPLGGEGYAGEECDVSTEEEYASLPQEVHFGRLNVGRSPVDVVNRQLGDVLDVLADTDLSWDAAARLMAHGVEVDSPLQSLAIHRELLLRGELGTSVELPELPWIDPDGLLDEDEFARLNSLELAAAALGSASDKAFYDVPGIVTLDLVVYNNSILQIPENSSFERIYGDGIIGVKDWPYYDFGSYSYDRGAKFPGCVHGITTANDTFKGTIMHYVFGDQSFSAGDVFGFATAADDSRRVIAFEHDTSFYIVLGIDKAGMTDVCVEQEIEVDP